MPTPANLIYDEYNTPRMGNVRKTSLKNPLLVKPRLGLIRRPTQDLPDPDYIYGVCNDLEAEGVREVLIYQPHVPDPAAIRGPNLVAMNKLAAKMNLVKASEQRPFRKKNYIPLSISTRVGGRVILPSTKNPNHVYGYKVEKNEDMDMVMRHGYADEWIKLQMFHQHKYDVPKTIFIPPKTNKATVMAANACFHRMHIPQPKERFILSKFKNVPHKIDNVQHIPLKRD